MLLFLVRSRKEGTSKNAIKELVGIHKGFKLSCSIQQRKGSTKKTVSFVLRVMYMIHLFCTARSQRKPTMAMMMMTMKGIELVGVVGFIMIVG